MTFEQAVNVTVALRGHYRPGLQGVKNRDRNRIRASHPRRLRGSVDLDRALGSQRPNEPVWDYGIGHRGDLNRDRAIWLEVHPAFHVDEVLAKLQWLRGWLDAEAPELRQITGFFVWVASGEVPFTANSPLGKRIAQKGLLFRSKLLDLEELA